MLWPLTASLGSQGDIYRGSSKSSKKKAFPHIPVFPPPGWSLIHWMGAKFLIVHRQRIFMMHLLYSWKLFPFYSDVSKVFYTVMCTFSRRCCHACFISSFQQLSREKELLKEAQNRVGEHAHHSKVQFLSKNSILTKSKKWVKNQF